LAPMFAFVWSSSASNHDWPSWWPHLTYEHWHFNSFVL